MYFSIEVLNFKGQNPKVGKKSDASISQGVTFYICWLLFAFYFTNVHFRILRTFASFFTKSGVTSRHLNAILSKVSRWIFSEVLMEDVTLVQNEVLKVSC